MGQSAEKIKIYNILSETSCEIFTPFFYRTVSEVFVVPPRIATLAAEWRIYLWPAVTVRTPRGTVLPWMLVATLFLNLFFAGRAALPMFLLSFFPSTISILCKLVDTGRIDSPYLWMTLPMDLVGRVKSLGVSLSRHLALAVCACVCVHVRVCFAFLLCFAISPVGKFLTCYYKDMTQCTRECDREPVFLLFFFPSLARRLFHLACGLYHQPTPWKHTDIKCSLWLLISGFALGLSGWHC